MSDDGMSVYPVSGRQHDVDSEHCWCGPEVMQLCLQCGGEERVGCWKCDGRGLEPEYDDTFPAVIIHREAA